MARRDIIVIGASAGGVQALEELLHGLPANLPASIFIVVHTSSDGAGVLPQVLSRSSAAPVRFATHGEPVRPGMIRVAPPGHHLLLGRSTVMLSRGPRENGFRPAVDPLFRTAARAFDGRSIGIILSGSLDDGTDGLALIKSRRGITIAQDPCEALFDSMPRNAIEYVSPDYVLRVSQMPAVLAQLVNQDAPREQPMYKPSRLKVDDAAVGTAALAEQRMAGPPSEFRCPECGGALWEEDHRNGQTQLRCHVGHAFALQGFTELQAQQVEAALWTSVRVLEEQATLRRRLALRARTHKLRGLVPQLQRRADEAENRATAVRAVLLNTPIAQTRRALRKTERHPRPGTRGGNGAQGRNGERQRAKRR